VIERWHCPPERCWKMSHGAYVFGTQPVKAAVHPRGCRPLHLLFFGRISRYKGLDRLFAAMQLLRQRDLHCKLVVAGSGSLDDFQEQLAAPDVEVHNAWLDEEQIAAALAASDLVVLPYELSSQSGVAAAAHAAGRPVVATPIGGLCEQIPPSTGLLARDMSAEAFADALSALMTDPVLFDRCAAGALQHAQTELDWHNCAEVLHDAVQQVFVMPKRTAMASVGGGDHGAGSGDACALC
jgi:glycosyltransferase involved in cell wall biosynthesis